MKKNLFILLLSMCCIVTFAQESNMEYTYRPLSEFGTDTLRFLKTNFEHRSDYFKGKPLSEVLKYYKRDLPISVFYSNDTSPYIDPEGRSYIDSFTISHYELTYYLAALKDKKTKVLSFDVYISQNPRIDDSNFWRNMPDFETDEEEAEYAGKLIVDHIKAFYVIKR